MDMALKPNGPYIYEASTPRAQAFLRKYEGPVVGNGVLDLVHSLKWTANHYTGTVKCLYHTDEKGLEA